MTNERYAVELTRQAEKDLKQLRPWTNQSVQYLLRLESDPYLGHQLKGSRRGVRSLEFSPEGSGAYRATHIVLEEEPTWIVWSVERTTIVTNAGDLLPPRTLADPHRPRYHFLPPGQWMNDPNGLIQWKGNYHLFYQFAEDAEWRLKLWGHAVSHDLVRWRDLPIALAPTPGGADANGCWSGCTVGHNGVPTFIYSGDDGDPYQHTCLATSRDDELLSWKKSAANPVIAGPPDGIEPVIFRDHSVWNEGGTWYQVIGSGIRGVGGAALLYRSADLINWEYLHPLCVGDKERTEPVWTGIAWECPDFFALDGEQVLLVSAWDGHPHYVACLIGEYEQHRLTPRLEGVVDAGGHFYAPQVFIDDRGRRIMFGWLIEGRSRAAQRAAGWSGAMSLPRVLSILPDGTLGQAPAPELTALRREHRRITDQEIATRSLQLLHGIDGDSLEIVAEIDPGDVRQVGVMVRCAPDDEEATLISYEPSSSLLAIDARHASRDPEATGDRRTAQLELPADVPLRLQIFLDGSVLEVFANDRVCLSDRIYPTRPDSLGIKLFAHGGTARLVSLDVWQLASIY